jgi:hypothetical protein
MPAALDLIRDNRMDELWQKCCGFIDLSMDEFMTIQKELLLEQLELLNKSELGNKIMGCMPGSIEEFRTRVPITTYDNYAPYLLEQREDILPEKPMLWQHTSGRSGKYDYKWVPVTERMYREIGDSFLGLLIFASCSGRGDVTIREHDKFLYGLAPPPYASGCWAHRAAEEEIFDFLPPIEIAENLPFQKRIEEGFKMGMSEGIDIMAAISSMLVAVGDRFSQGGSAKRILQLIKQPRLLARLLKAVMKSKLARRPLLPRDIWTLKGLVSTGTDSVVYREKIKEMWGRYPLDIYGATETTIVAMQTWDFGDMTLVPNFNFLEFIPEDEYQKWSADTQYSPVTVLADGLVPGEKYVLVITNFNGGAFVRYLVGDMVEITSLKNEKLNIQIPQMRFYARADDILDFTYASFTEEKIWRAIEASGISYVDWVARKEIKDTPKLSIYIEQKPPFRDDKQVTELIDDYFKTTKEDYAHMVNDLGYQLLNVTSLPTGAFQNYMAERQAAGSDLAHLKPPRINPSDNALSVLQSSEEKVTRA